MKRNCDGKGIITGDETNRDCPCVCELCWHGLFPPCSPRAGSSAVFGALGWSLHEAVLTSVRGCSCWGDPECWAGCRWRRPMPG